MSSPPHSRVITLAILMALLAQPILVALSISKPAIVRAQVADTLYLPNIEVEPSAGPKFVISSPVQGSFVSGTFIFSIQPFNIDEFTAVTFYHNAGVLGSDNNGRDGFQIFVNAADLSEGRVQLQAIATGPNGTASQSQQVTVVKQPPASGEIGVEGGVLATSTGSTLSFLPGTVATGTVVSVAERKQNEVTSDHGIEWEAIGVTFLGLQNIESTGRVDGPLGAVSSSGFGNRVQPGQTVVNYRIMPDADGDGVDEIVVANTASTAPNNDVVAAPLSPITIHSLLPNGGMPGTLLKVEVTGFNPASMAANIAVFTSDMDGSSLEIPIGVSLDASSDANQIAYLPLPPLPEGAATLSFRNESTGATSVPVKINIQKSFPLTTPGAQVIEEVYGQHLHDVTQTLNHNREHLQPDQIDAFERYIARAQMARDHLLSAYQQLQDIPSATERKSMQDKLDKIAQMLNAGKQYLAPAAGISNLPASTQQSIFGLSESGINFLNAVYTFGAFLGRHVITGAIGAAILAASEVGLAAVAAAGIIYYGCKLLGCFDTPQPIPCSLTGNIPLGPTGMGSALPPGGSGCGNGWGYGGTNPPDQPAPANTVVVKVFSGGKSIPFTGMTDPSGYFFVPFIPAGNPFSAVALDMATGQIRTFRGIGPETGSSVHMDFDFYQTVDESPTIKWDGGGDGTSWHDPLNWDRDEVPDVVDRVLIDVPGDAKIILSTDSTTILSLHSEEEFTIQKGSLTLLASSMVTGPFWMGGNTKLSISGFGTTFIAANTINIDAASLNVVNGSKLVLQGLTSYKARNYAVRFRASGIGSVLDLPALTSLSGDLTIYESFGIEALAGGQVRLQNIVEMGNNEEIDLRADGIDSTIYLDKLTTFRGDDSPRLGNSTIEAKNGGLISASNLTHLNGAELLLNSTGTIATRQITQFTDGRVVIDGVNANLGGMLDIAGSEIVLQNGGTANLANASMIDRAKFLVTGGVTLALPSATSYHPDPSKQVWFRASGSDSMLDLSALTSLTGSQSTLPKPFRIEALAGGQIQLGHISEISTGAVNITADGTNSVVDLSSLTAFTAAGDFIEVNGGVILRP